MKRKFKDRVLAASVWLAAGFTIFVMLFLIGYILVKGIPYVTPSLFAVQYTTENVSLLPALITTIMMVVLSLAVAVPLGMFTAIYTVEYASRGNRFVKLVRVMAETLSGIPSIVYGLFGLLFFVTWLGWGFSLLAGGFTLAIMI